jgi:hypothetical protein
MKPQNQPITNRIIVTYQGPSGIVAKVNGKPTHFQNREDLFRAAVLLAERSAKDRKTHLPPDKGM